MLLRYNSMLQIISVGSIILPVLLSQMEQPATSEEPSLPNSNAIGVACATMPAAQLAGMEAVVRLANTSCMYNISIGPAGVILQ